MPEYHAWTHRPKAQGGTDPIEVGGPLPSFRAWHNDLVPSTRVYPSDEESLDTVFWDTWDTSFDTTVFLPFVQSSGSEIGKLGAVTLLKSGLYIIFARIDWEDFFTGEVRIGGNYDDAPIHTKNHASAAAWTGPDGFTEARYMWPNFFGDENSVEVVVGQDSGGGLTIPGGNSGAWAMPPELSITYLGAIDSADSFGTVGT